VIFTDSSNTINIFSSLQYQPLYNPILCLATDILLTSRLQLHMVHLPGLMNIMADLLSRGQLMEALTRNPNLTIHSFEPLLYGWGG